VFTFGTQPKGPNSDLAKSIFNPEIASKQSRTHLRYRILSRATPTEYKGIVCKKKMSASLSSFLAPSEKPEIKLPITAAAIILLKTSMTIAKSNETKDHLVSDHESY
jgi:hypothetical protein